MTYKITIFAIHSPFLFLLFLGGKRKGEKNNQSRDFKSCLSARSIINLDVVWDLHGPSLCQVYFFVQPELQI
jgi:hypothetical protein